jgi:ribosomal protein L37AE/L43A
VRSSSLASRLDSLVCPLCEANRLRHSGHDSQRCQSCGGHLSGAVLQTLRQIISLPDALGSHACEECAHPQMRLLPDGTFHCPSCGSEVLPFTSSSIASKPEDHSETSQMASKTPEVRRRR